MLNEFTGRSTESLKSELHDLLDRLDQILESDEELGGGSPLEYLYEQIDALEREIERRGS